MYARGVGLRPETIEAVEWIRREDPHCELDPEGIVWVADQCGACADAVLLLSRLVMSDAWQHYVDFSERYDFGPMTIWSVEAACAVLATGLPLDGVKFRNVSGDEYTADDLYRIAHGLLDTDLPQISTAADVLGSLEDQRIEGQAEQPLQRAA